MALTEAMFLRSIATTLSTRGPDTGFKRCSTCPHRRFRGGRKIDDDDFEDVVAPVLRQQIAGGHKLRLLSCWPQLREYDGDAAQEEFKFAARHATAYERVGVVRTLTKS